MKLSKRSIGILSNFAGYNENVLILPGRDQKTMTEQKNVYANAQFEEDFPVEVPIYNLSEFLKAISLLNDPDLEFGDKSVLIKDGDSKIVYTYAEKSVITYPQKEIKFPDVDVSFNLPITKFERVLNAAKGLSLPTISLMNVDGKLTLRAHDASNADSNKYDLTLDADVADDFQVNFKMEHLRMLGLDYLVEVSFKGISRFTNEKEGVRYMVGLQVARKP